MEQPGTAAYGKISLSKKNLKRSKTDQSRYLYSFFYFAWLLYFITFISVEASMPGGSMIHYF